MAFELGVKTLKLSILACVGNLSQVTCASVGAATAAKPTVIKSKTGTVLTVPSSTGAAGASRSAILPQAPAVPVVPDSSSSSSVSHDTSGDAIYVEPTVNGFGKSTISEVQLITTLRVRGTLSKKSKVSDSTWKSVVDAGFLGPENLSVINNTLKDNDQIRDDFAKGLVEISNSGLEPSSVAQIINGVLLNIGSGSLKEAKLIAGDFASKRWDKLLAVSEIEKRALAIDLSIEDRSDLIKQTSIYIAALEKAVQAGSYDKLNRVDQMRLASYFGSEAAAKQQTAENLKGHLENNQKLLGDLKKNEPSASESWADHFQGSDEAARMFHILLNDNEYRDKLTRSEAIMRIKP